MGEIKRYGEIPGENGIWPVKDGGYVTYEDHLAAIKDQMKEEKAREILGKAIDADGNLEFDQNEPHKTYFS